MAGYGLWAGSCERDDYRTVLPFRPLGDAAVAGADMSSSSLDMSGGRAGDMARAADMATPPDMPPDMATPPDMAVPADMATSKDMATSPDLATSDM